MNKNKKFPYTRYKYLNENIIQLMSNTKNFKKLPIDVLNFVFEWKYYFETIGNEEYKENKIRPKLFRIKLTLTVLRSKIYDTYTQQATYVEKYEMERYKLKMYQMRRKSTKKERTDEWKETIWRIKAAYQVLHSQMTFNWKASLIYETNPFPVLGPIAKIYEKLIKDEISCKDIKKSTEVYKKSKILF